MVHDDDDAGSAEAHDRVAGSARFTLKKTARSLKTRNIAHLRRTSVGWWRSLFISHRVETLNDKDLNKEVAHRR